MECARRAGCPGPGVGSIGAHELPWATAASRRLR
ncbi:hypothetical protein JOF29_004437 [Kribbella aluminosa]|uniref:Uncharacterized protein n=1 Tax=Kribbella aluminosa TaxID=416017 RepID=A0ABS4UNW2_9ACTN|nr:hypothetical protein [Kribbella aluminosa]